METISDLEKAIIAQSEGPKMDFRTAENFILGEDDLLEKYCGDLGIEQDSEAWQRLRDLQHEAILSATYAVGDIDFKICGLNGSELNVELFGKLYSLKVKKGKDGYLMLLHEDGSCSSTSNLYTDLGALMGDNFDYDVVDTPIYKYLMSKGKCNNNG